MIPSIWRLCLGIIMFGVAPELGSGMKLAGRLFWMKDERIGRLGSFLVTILLLNLNDYYSLTSLHLISVLAVVKACERTCSRLDHIRSFSPLGGICL